MLGSFISTISFIEGGPVLYLFSCVGRWSIVNELFISFMLDTFIEGSRMSGIPRVLTCLEVGRLFIGNFGLLTRGDFMVITLDE